MQAIIDPRMKVAEYQSFDGVLYDITAPNASVEVKYSTQPAGEILWVNVGGTCVLRICMIKSLEIDPMVR